MSKLLQKEVDVAALLEKAKKPATDAMKLHPFYRGKIESAVKCRMQDYKDFAIWYTPGVAAPCKAIAQNPDLVYEFTNKWNTVAVISDGTRVLGLGDIGPKAGLPVMEGKSLLYKYLGGVDSFPLTLDTKDPDLIIQTVLLLQPAFGGVNLEDISQPKCFRILDTLREKAEIPIWHDDQQGTATVTLAGLMNALKIVGKKKEDTRIAFVGSGAAGIASSRLIFAWGVNPENCIMVDINGTLGRFRKDVELQRHEFAALWRLCLSTNKDGVQGGIKEAMRGADVVIAYSSPGPGIIHPEWISQMNKDPIIFACANPVPEIWPWEAQQAGAAIIATGRSDFPNQVNNSLCFPGLFRGALDVRARMITDEMCFAAAEALANEIGDDLDENHLLPPMDDIEIFIREAAAVGMKAQEQGIAKLQKSYDDLYREAREMITRSHRLTEMMMQSGIIPPSPEQD
jgi:malate dehydrogenase (oxaloacetate-decarboxylating)